MHDVSNAISILDPSNTIDAKICKTGSNDWATLTNSGDRGSTGKCATKASDPGNTPGLKKVVSAVNQPTDNTFTDDKKMGDYLPKTSAIISGDISNLAREQKGVVSSAFAKALEGAEIPV